MVPRHVAASMLLLVALPAAAAKPITYMQVLIGTYDSDDSAWQVNDEVTGEVAHADIGTLWFVGGVGQQLWGDGVLQYGYEGGLLATRKEDSTNFLDATDTVRATIDSSFYAVSLLLGPVVSVRPIANLRLYVAAGPAVTWAYMDQDIEEDTPPPNALNVDFSEGYNDVAVEAYARGGVEVVFDNGFTIGASVRYADDTFDFGESGEIELESTLWLLTLGGRI